MLFLPKNFIKGNANMSNRKQTKRALLTSIMALVMCVVMLVGTTFAWFTDTASTNVNKIEAGKLDVQMLDKGDNDLEGKTLNWVKAEGGKNQQVLWEPGCSYDLESFKIKNNGNLKLKYKVLINGLIGNAELLNAIDFTVAVADPALTPKDGTSTVSTVADLNSFEGKLDAGAETSLITITGKMKTDAGNTYQGKTIDGIAITVYAAQVEGEFDSTRMDYDKDATYDYTFVAGNSEAETALSANKENIYVALAGDVTFDVKPYDQKPMGGADTKLIVIEGHGHKLTFNNTNSDWNNVTWGDAKLVIKNAVIDNSGYNAAGGAWISHDIYFNGHIELENVTFTNAVALNGKATLTNVQISDQNAAQDTYMLWICAGSNVTLNNVTIDGKSAVGKANRAIAIKDEYIANPTDTMLTVNGLTATSDKYAAIYVTSKSATMINLNGVIDVTGAAVSDKLIQESSNSTGTVTVNDNSTKVVKAATQEELKNAIAASENMENTRIGLSEGEYEVDSTTVIGAGATLAGEGIDKTTLTAKEVSVSKDNITIKDMTIKADAPEGNSGALAINSSAKNTVIENVNFVGQGFNGDTKGISTSGENLVIRNSKISNVFRGIIFWDNIGGDNVIEDCVIDNVIYTFNINAATVKPGTTLTVKNSTLNGWTSYSGCMTKVSFDKCDLGKSNGYAHLVAYADSEFTGCTFNDGYQIGAGSTGKTLTFTNCKLGDGTVITAENFAEKLGDVDNDMKGCTAIVDGATVNWN